MSMKQEAKIAGGARATVSRVVEGAIGLPLGPPCPGEQGPQQLAVAPQSIVAEGSE